MAVWKIVSIILPEIAAIRPAALEPIGLFDLDAVGRGESVERVAVLELVEQVGGLRLQSRCDLVLAPALFNLALDLVERTIARRRDAGNVIPDVTAVGLDRIVIDADIGSECGADDIAGMGQAGDDLAGRIAAGAIDRIEGDAAEASAFAPPLPV